MNTKTEINLFHELIKEIYEYSLYTMKSMLGFMIADSFLNYQSMMVWNFSLSALDFISIRIFSYLLEQMLPQKLHFMLRDHIIAQFLSMGILSIFFNQPLILFVFARVMYYLFVLYASIFASLPLESIGIAYYAQSFWFVVPFMINILLTFFYLFDMSFNAKVFLSILDLSIIRGFLNDIGIRVESIYAKPQEDIKNSLRNEEEFIISQLKYRMSSYKNRSNISKFKEYLRQQFEKNPGRIRGGDGQSIALALDANQFVSSYPSDKKNKILMQYYQNHYHTVYRMMTPDNHLLAQDDDSRMTHQLIHDSLYQDWIVLNWLLAIENQQDKFYVEQLAKHYRGRNFQMSNARLFMTDINHHGMDKPGDLNTLRLFLAGFSDKYAQLDILNLDKLNKLLEEFVSKVWEQRLQHMNKLHILKLKKLWEESGQKFSYLSYFNINDQEIEHFICQMELRYKERWSSQRYYLDYVEDFFKLKVYFTNHAHKFSLMFEQKLTEFEPSNRCIR